MGRGMAFMGPVMAGVFGVLTVYTTLRPELIKEKAHREQLDPEFVRQHPDKLAEDEKQAAEAQQNTAISRAIVDDFKEAGQQITQGGGFAWKIRQAIFGGKNDAEKK
ncbi:hypothetical protein Q7P35_009468 [Cladosporium inversicolor]